MLTSGMVPALFADDEKESIIGQVICNFDERGRNLYFFLTGTEASEYDGFKA